jgi:large conductance mechanosensitive channel
MLNEFRDFLFKTNALALAVGVIIGAATGKVVSAVVDDLLMPVIGLVLPAGDWRNAQFVLTQGIDAAGNPTVNAIKYGHFLSATIDFVIIAFVVFLIARLVLPKEEPPATKQCPECLESVPAAAHKCKACTTALA